MVRPIRPLIKIKKIAENPTLKMLLKLNAFERVVFLSDKQKKAEIDAYFRYSYKFLFIISFLLIILNL
jgi:hypothetical protein